MVEERKVRGAGLSREKVLAAALAIADAEGLQAVPLYQHFSRVMLAHVMLETEAGPYLEKRREQARLARITFETLSSEDFPYLVEAAAQLGAPHDPERA